MYDCVLVNGDSYSATKMFDSYADYLGTKLNVPVLNIAAPGSNNDRIVRSTIEKVIELQKQNKNPLIVIGWSFIRRIEVWYYGNKETILNRTPDIENQPLHQQPRFVTLDVLLTENEATVEQKCLIQDDMLVHKQLTDFYTGMYLLAQTLNHLGMPWFMFSAAKNIEIPVDCFPYIHSLKHVQWCLEQPNIHDLHKFCIMTWAKEHDPDCSPVTGHLSKTGHEKFSEVLLQWLRSSKIV